MYALLLLARCSSTVPTTDRPVDGGDEGERAPKNAKPSIKAKIIPTIINNCFFDGPHFFSSPELVGVSLLE